MSPIEEEYRRRVDAMTPSERVKRAADMAFWARGVIARQILAEKGPRSEERLKWEVAERVYIGDRRALSVIRQELANVPD